MRYAVSGANTVVVSGGTGSATGIVQYLMGQAVTPGRVFWLRGLWMMPTGTVAAIGLYDLTAGATMEVAGANATNRVAAVLPPTAGNINRGTITEFAPPGLKFTTGVCLRPIGTGNVTWQVGEVGGCGYEEDA